ncbi:MAG: hypothetical protein Q7S02_05395 [bacterium]|nr:hypothetical protein [bacterium]
MSHARVGRSETRVEQSAVNGAPQCPKCWAHTMVEQGDGTFTCPSGCPGHAVVLRGWERMRDLPKDAERFFGTFGGEFALCGPA